MGAGASGVEADGGCVSVRGYRLHPRVHPFSSPFRVEGPVRSGSPLPSSSDCLLGREGGGGAGDGGGEGDHRPEEDLSSLACRGWIEGRHGGDEVAAGSGRTVEGF